MIFGITDFGTIWFIIGIILGVILLFLLGIFYDENIDGDNFFKQLEELNKKGG